MGTNGGRRRGPSVRDRGRRAALLVALASTLTLVVFSLGGAAPVGADATSAPVDDAREGPDPAAVETDRDVDTTSADGRSGAAANRSEATKETERRIGPAHRHGSAVVDRGSEATDDDRPSAVYAADANASGAAGSEDGRSETRSAAGDGGGDRRSTAVDGDGRRLATAVVAPVAGVLAVALAVRSARRAE